MTDSGQPRWLCISILAASAFLAGVSGSVLSINLSTLRQLATPEGFLGRVFASQRLGMSALAIVGGLVSGGLMEVAGYGVVIWVTTALSLILPVVIAATGLWRIGGNRMLKSIYEKEGATRLPALKQIALVPSYGISYHGSVLG